MWKFQNLSDTHISREIDFRNSRTARIAVLTIFDFDEYLQFLRPKIWQNVKIRAFRTERWALFELIEIIGFT